MIKINGQDLSVKRFPAGEVAINFEVKRGEQHDVYWRYENDGELFQLFAVAEHIKEHGGKLGDLAMPYCPNSRMDRVKNPQTEVFTLKYFIGVINGLGFERVYIDNPHSDVCMTINGAVAGRYAPKTFVVTDCFADIDKVIAEIDADSRFNSSRDIVFYPDYGAMKRYADKIAFPYLWGNKVRNWKTHDIERYDIIGRLSEIKMLNDIRKQYAVYWNKLNAKRDGGAYAWDKNPWVFTYNFEKISE